MDRMYTMSRFDESDEQRQSSECSVCECHIYLDEAIIEYSEYFCSESCLEEFEQNVLDEIDTWGDDEIETI